MDEVVKSGDMPNDAKIIAQILKSMGIDEVEGRVIPQLLEFMHRYVREVLEDAAIYANHAGKASVLDLDDVRLAIQSRVNYSFTQPPPREFLIELAHTKNVVPLPFPPLRSLLPSSTPSSSTTSSSPLSFPSPPPPTMSAVVLPPLQFRVKPLKWDWPQSHSDSTTPGSSSSSSSPSPSLSTSSSSASTSSSSSSAPALSSSSSPSPSSDAPASSSSPSSSSSSSPSS